MRQRFGNDAVCFWPVPFVANFCVFFGRFSSEDPKPRCLRVLARICRVLKKRARLWSGHGARRSTISVMHAQASTLTLSHHVCVLLCPHLLRAFAIAHALQRTAPRSRDLHMWKWPRMHTWRTAASGAAAAAPAQGRGAARCSRSCSGPRCGPLAPGIIGISAPCSPPRYLLLFPHAHPREPFASALSAMQAAGTCTGTRCRKFWQPCAAGTNTSLRGES
jgi:hypothetical protein